MSDVARVFLYALATALATGVGALPFLVVRTLSDRVIAASNAIASHAAGVIPSSSSAGTVDGEGAQSVAALGLSEAGSGKVRSPEVCHVRRRCPVPPA